MTICGVRLRNGDAFDVAITLSAALTRCGYGELHSETLGSAAFARHVDARFPLRGPRVEVDLMIVADARVDDRATLIAKLAAKGLAPDPDDDRALILAAYRCWGADCPAHLIGDYAFAIYDAARHRLFCARDHVGARPFYYATTPEGFVFASDPQALLAVPGVGDALDEPFVAATLLSRQFHSADRTFISAIRKLPPGHRLTLGEGLQIDRYWFPERLPSLVLADDAAYTDRAKQLLSVAVADRLRDADRFGIHLSGGLDSSAIAAMAVPMLRERRLGAPVGFSWHRVDPGAKASTEPGWTEAIRAQLDLTVLAPELNRDEIVALLAGDPAREPDARNLLHEAAVQREAQKRGIQVILSGWGGDEGLSFNGRGYQQQLLLRGRWRSLVRHDQAFGWPGALRAIARAGRALLPELRGSVSLGGRARSGRTLANRDFLRRTRPLRVRRIRETSVRRAQLDLLWYSSTTVRMEDWARSGARRGIEYRYPLLDRRILEFALSVPPRLFRAHGVSRWLMRAAMDGVVPDTVRLNPTKQEPLRTEAIGSALRDAMLVIRSELAARTDPPVRAAYLDMDALNARLAHLSEKHPTNFSALRLALQFLDFR